MISREMQEQIQYILKRRIKVAYWKEETRVGLRQEGFKPTKSEEIELAHILQTLITIIETQDYQIEHQDKKKKAYIRELERKLGLGWGYLSNPATMNSPETVALLKCIESMPWLIEVAEYGFDPEISQLLLQRAAIDIKIKDRHNEKKSQALSKAKEQTDSPPKTEMP